MSGETIGVLIGFGSLGLGIVGLVINALKQAVAYGELRQRVKHLEEGALDHKLVSKAVAEFGVLIGGLQKSLDDVRSEVREALAAKSRRSRSTDNG